MIVLTYADTEVVTESMELLIILFDDFLQLKQLYSARYVIWFLYIFFGSGVQQMPKLFEF